MMVLRLLAFLTALAFAVSASAHDRSISYSTWDIRGRQAHITVRLAELDLSRLPWAATTNEQLDAAVGAYVTEQLQLRAGDIVCAVADGPRRLEATAGRAAYEWRVECPPSGALQIVSGLLLEVAPSHLHFARVARDGSPFLERVLSVDEPTWPLSGSSADSQEPLGTSLAGYVALGVEHIWSGYDHLAFLLALLLVASSLREIATVVTGFTVAHSITLAVAVLGYMRPAPAPIEALIGLSIALVAAEDMWLVGGRQRMLPWLIAGALACSSWLAWAGYGRVPTLALAGLALFSICYFSLVGRVARPAPLRWAIAFVFGLVHGFGFAAVLLEANLSPDRLTRALFGFNVGVELGQLAFVAVIWPLLRLAARARSARLHDLIVEFGSAAVFGVGLFWFVSRAYG
jgi:hypothetical protein